MYCSSVSFSVTMVLRMPFSIATSVPFLNCSMCVAWRFSAWPRGSITISSAPRLAACLKKVAATGWFSVGLAPITKMTSEFLHSLKVADTAPEPTPSISAATPRTRADPFHQRRHRRGVAQPRAMIDISGAEADANELLEQIGLFVRTLGRAETGQRLRPVAVAAFFQSGGGAIERLVPGRLAEM